MKILRINPINQLFPSSVGNFAQCFKKQIIICLIAFGVFIGLSVIFYKFYSRSFRANLLQKPIDENNRRFKPFKNENKNKSNSCNKSTQDTQIETKNETVSDEAPKEIVIKIESHQKTSIEMKNEKAKNETPKEIVVETELTQNSQIEIQEETDDILTIEWVPLSAVENQINKFNETKHTFQELCNLVVRIDFSTLGKNQEDQKSFNFLMNWVKKHYWDKEGELAFYFPVEKLDEEGMKIFFPNTEDGKSRFNDLKPTQIADIFKNLALYHFTFFSVYLIDKCLAPMIMWNKNVQLTKEQYSCMFPDSTEKKNELTSEEYQARTLDETRRFLAIPGKILSDFICADFLTPNQYKCISKYQWNTINLLEREGVEPVLQNLFGDKSPFKEKEKHKIFKNFDKKLLLRTLKNKNLINFHQYLPLDSISNNEINI